MESSVTMNMIRKPDEVGWVKGRETSVLVGEKTHLVCWVCSVMVEGAWENVMAELVYEDQSGSWGPQYCGIPERKLWHARPDWGGWSIGPDRSLGAFREQECKGNTDP